MQISFPGRGTGANQYGSRLGTSQRVVVGYEFFGSRTRSLKPFAVHVEPRERVRGTVVWIEKLFTIETVASVDIALVQDDAGSQFAPL
jgi:hypothetical protein